MYDDTLIIFTSDHGELLGDYNCLGKRTMLDAASNIPFLLKVPGQEHTIRHDPASLVDLAPTLLSASETAVGLAWKSGVAAEVIAMTSGTIGENIYNNKVWLNTPALFAWTVIIVLASLASEKLILFALRLLLGERRALCKTSAS